MLSHGFVVLPTGCFALIREAPVLDAGASIAGFREKKPAGARRNPVGCTGMTGQSSARGMWVTPRVYQTTMSRSSIGRLALVHFGNPSPSRLKLTYSPEGNISSGLYGVTHKCALMNPALRLGAEP